MLSHDVDLMVSAALSIRRRVTCDAHESMNPERSLVVSQLKSRVLRNLSNTIEDRDCVALCIAASLPRDREELFGFLLSNKLCRVAMKSAEELSIKEEEWVKLFGKDAVFTTEAHASGVVKESGLSGHLDSISGALRCSLTEPLSKASWQKATSKLSCFVALYTDSSEEFISHVLGGLVRADTRRLDDVRCSVEDEETDHMLLCKGVLALAASVS